MCCRISYTPDFARQLKRLGKRYKSIKEDYARLLDELRSTPNMGVDLGHHLRKVRMSIASKGKGKSGGARVITYTLILAETDTEIKLLTIYDKSDRESLTDKELLDLLIKNGL
ncbi:MAG: type II toxin-antitoxin system RelE/ParE family toxin [Bacteroidaceae bacterium]|nr:type II toxin-antitoxin system RelE/ParE family toxin [Bacteroidaceae bacterium]